MNQNQFSPGLSAYVDLIVTDLIKQIFPNSVPRIDPVKAVASKKEKTLIITDLEKLVTLYIFIEVNNFAVQLQSASDFLRRVSLHVTAEHQKSQEPLLDEDLNAVEPSDLLGALSYIRNVYDTLPAR